METRNRLTATRGDKGGKKEEGIRSSTHGHRQQGGDRLWEWDWRWGWAGRMRTKGEKWEQP